MVDRKKSGKGGKPKPDEAKNTSDRTADVSGLAASLEALVPGSSKDIGKSEGEIVHLSSRKDEERADTAKSAKKLAHKWDETPANDHPGKDHKHRDKPSSPAVTKDEEPEAPEALGVVELLGALKSDIDSLRKDNEEFKAQLMSSPLTRGKSGDGGQDDSTDVRALLEALKADIGDLREENETMRAQTMGTSKPQPADQRSDEDEELYAMLGELKDDIVALRSENDALREGKNVPAIAARAGGKNDEVAMMLHELKGDINDLKTDNESLRLENLTARDGAHFENLGGQQGAYRNNNEGAMSSLLKGLGALVLVAGAAGGGYYLAQMQGQTANIPDQREIASTTAGKALEVSPPAKPAVTNKPVKAPVMAKVPTKPAASAPVPVAKTPARTTGISKDVETAMLARADGLLQTRDLGAARMVFVYLARQGSAGAMNRLAQTYDPRYLGSHQFDEAKNADVTRAKRLYGAASSMGDKAALARLQEMQ